MLARHISPFEGGRGDVTPPRLPQTSQPSQSSQPSQASQPPTIAGAARTPTFLARFLHHILKPNT